MAFLNGAPRDESEILNAATRFSAVQPTHLGETFRLRGTANASNLGETADAISLHIDLVYKQHPPDIQLLHVLKPADEGGENVFVDALQVIEQLEKEDVRLLRTTPVVFMAKSGTVDFRGVHTILAFDDSTRFQSVRHNEHKMVLPVETPIEFYRAFLRFRDIIERQENSLSIRLPADSMVIFDNARILHGRRSFKGVDRDVVGCFLSEDDLLSKWRLLKRAATVSPPG
jgi:gamma-butyrobetaine dioxygenase